MSNIQDQFEQAIRLRDEGKLQDAQAILEHVAKETSDFAAVFAVLGDLYWRQQLLDKAVEAFRSATVISPRSETASLSLFHVLWEQGAKDTAFVEMKRFLATNESKGYRRLLNDMEKGVETG